MDTDTDAALRNAQTNCVNGWASLPLSDNRSKFHYFQSGKSLCGKYDDFSVFPHTPDETQLRTACCKDCKRRLGRGSR